MGKRSDGTYSKGRPHINIRLSDEEKKILTEKAKAKGVSLSDYIRDKILKDD